MNNARMMGRMGPVGLVVLLLALMVAGCKSPEAAAYKSLGTIAVTVQGTMETWGQYVRAGHASDKDRAEVKAIYQHYQHAMKFAESSLNLSRHIENDRDKLDWPKLVSQVSFSAVQVDVTVHKIMEDGKGLVP